MTIFRELQSATVKGYTLAQDTQQHPIAGVYSVDDYGQLVPSSTTRDIEITIKPYSQQNVTDPRYVDVEAVGLTRDYIAPGEVISLAQGDFRVKYVIPTPRWQEALLVRL